MFKYINFEQSTMFWLILSFVLTFGVFLTTVVWAMLMKPSRRDHLASLPLDASEHPQPDESQSR